MNFGYLENNPAFLLSLCLKFGTTKHFATRVDRRECCQLCSADDRRRLITLSVHLCVVCIKARSHHQHVECNRLNARATTLSNRQAFDLSEMLLIRQWMFDMTRLNTMDVMQRVARIPLR